MNKEEKFNDLIEVCIKNNQYIGLGNPNANILIIGKEAGIGEKEVSELDIHESNAFVWKSDKEKYSKAYFPQQKKLQNGNHTWQKYQKFYNLIAEKESEQYCIDFVENVFTTELSNATSPNSAKAKQASDFKKNLDERKKLFFKHPFIQSFPIVIIVALDGKYISHVGKGNFKEVFDVKYTETKKIENSSNVYYVHHGKTVENTPKLLLHTRQFTNGASNKLLEGIANEVRNFAQLHSIKIS